MKEKEKNPNSERGRKSRAKGGRFEAKVRQELEELLGWTVSKWTNTVEFEKNGNIGKLVPAKRKYNPFLKTLSIGTGFPDFVCFKRNEGEEYEVIGLEVKGNGYLDKFEKGMCIWLLEHKIFSRILIAKRGKERGKIEYIDFVKKYKKL
jgi:hypothetical protein